MNYGTEVRYDDIKHGGDTKELGRDLDLGRKSVGHLAHYRLGCNLAILAAKEHLYAALKNSNEVPQVFKPASITWDDFHGDDILGAFDWSFTEINRVRAEKLGIFYGSKVTSYYSQGLVTKEIENAKKEAESSGKEFNPDDSYTAELRPIVPKQDVLNHDRGLYPYSPYMALYYYLDFLGEGKMTIKSPFGISVLPLVKEEIDQLFDWEELSQDLPDSEKEYLSYLHGRSKYIIEVINYYNHHLTVLRQTGCLLFHQKPDFIYLKSYDLDQRVKNLEGLRGNNALEVRFQVDVQELLKYRNIFADPEQIDMSSEYGMTYIVPGGIPIQAIQEATFWADYDFNPPPVQLKEN